MSTHRKSAIKVGDRVTWRKGKSVTQKDGLRPDPIGSVGCVVLKLGTTNAGEPAALIRLADNREVGALLADLEAER
jgi:hypothetical protein